MQLPQKLKQFNQVVGLQIHRVDTARLMYYYVVLQRKGESINTITSGKALHLEELKDKLDSQTPVAVCLTGKGIFHKGTDYLPPSTDEALQIVLPNAATEDFIVQTFENTRNRQISIFRKESVEQHLNALKEIGVSIIQFELGPFGIQSILPLFSGGNETLFTPGNEISQEQNELLEVTPSNKEITESYTLGSEQVSGEYLLAFASAFQLFVGQIARVSNIEETTAAKENFFLKRFSKYAGWGILGSVFLLLLVNFLLFNYLTKATQSQQVELNYHETQLKQLEVLRTRYDDQANFLKQNNVLKASKTSFYADEIAASLPKGLELTELLIFPDEADRREQRENKFRFASNIIRIKGKTRRPVLLNEWIRDLKSLDWVNRVTVLPYSESVNGVGEFALEVEIVP